MKKDWQYYLAIFSTASALIGLGLAIIGLPEIGILMIFLWGIGMFIACLNVE